MPDTSLKQEELDKLNNDRTEIIDKPDVYCENKVNLIDFHLAQDLRLLISSQFNSSYSYVRYRQVNIT